MGGSGHGLSGAVAVNAQHIALGAAIAAFKATFGNETALPGSVTVDTWDRIWLLSTTVTFRASHPAWRGFFLVAHEGSIAIWRLLTIVPQIERIAI